MNGFLERTYFSNTVKDYIISLTIILAGILLMRVFKQVFISKVTKRIRALQTIDNNFVIHTIVRFGLPALSLLIVYWGLHYLTLTEKADKVISIAISVIVAFLILRLISVVLKHSLHSYVIKQDNGEEKAKQLGGILLILNILVWILGIVFLFNNLGYDVSAIIAGLGIGGIAVALAAQNILGDLFNYFVIYFDRPFEIGDSISVGDKSGTVERIGIKTTRLKSISGEQLVFSNSDLTGSRIHNYKRMERRRAVFNLGVTYKATAQQLASIPTIIRAAIEEQQDVTFDRSHLVSFQEASINFESVYIVLSDNYNKYMDIQQAINLTIFEAFSKEGIEFAHATRLIYERKSSEKEE